MAPFLSICILAYNRVRTLRETLENLMPQVDGRTDVEVMVFDDASPDTALEPMMRELCEKHPRLTYVRHAVNKGQDGNTIASIEAAQGEYISLFSDDDVVPADYVERLVADLKETQALVVYVNHTPFYDDDPKKLGLPTQPVLKRVFTNPTEYFLYTGLGFMTAVTVKTSEARKQVGKVNRGLASAHVDICSRVVLTNAGPYLFDGTLSVLARHEMKSTYDVLTNGVMNVTKVHEGLMKEGLLTQKDVDWFNVKAIKLFLPRCIVNNRLNGRRAVTAGELKALYGRYPEFYRIAYPLAVVPPKLLKMMAVPARAVMRMRRERRLKSGELGKQHVHLAPE